MALPAEKRGPCTSVIQRLLEEPYRFDFIQAVRLFELCLRASGEAPEQALERYLRFDNSLSLSFPASQIEALVLQSDEEIDGDVALLEAVRSNALKHIRITPAFFGFLGTHGVMPLHYTERIADYVHSEDDDGPRAFLDSFSHRSLMMFYMAMKAGRIECSRDADGNDGFLPLQLALAGRAAQESPPSGLLAVPDSPIPQEVVAHYAALIRQRSASASAIMQILSEYFNVPVAVEQFTGRMEKLPLSEQIRLGEANCTLGGCMILGDEYARPDGGARLRIGPLSKTQFDRFLPGADCAIALNAMLALFATGPVRYEVRLILRAEDVCGIRLVAEGEPGAARLGWDSFLITEPEQRDRDDVSYVLNPMDD